MQSIVSQQVIGSQAFASIITKFVGENFHLWKFKMQMLLKDKELWSIVLGTKVKLTCNFVEWEKRDKKARTSIFMGLYASLLQNFIGAKT
jgi:hypothetical protein